MRVWNFRGHYKPGRRCILKRIIAVATAMLCFLLAVVLCFFVVGHSFIGLFFAGVGCLLLAFTGLGVMKNKRTAVILRRLLLGLLVTGVILFTALEIPVLINAKSDADVEASYLIVLGAGVNGTTPSLILQDRLREALAYLEQYPDAIAVVSGGQGPGEDITEAEAMQTWLLEHGIPQARIIKEDAATSTEENIVFSMKKIRENGGEGSKIAIVTNEWHVYRAKYIAKSLGCEAVCVAAETSWLSLAVNYSIREAFATLKMYLF